MGTGAGTGHGIQSFHPAPFTLGSRSGSMTTTGFAGLERMPPLHCKDGAG
jgi:hypothetical protein